jgi:hypothetical protein
MSLFVFNEVILCFFALNEKLGGTTSLSINLVPSIMKGRGFLFLALNTAVDFRARLRFPRVTREPPRSFAASGSHIRHFSRRSLRLALQSTAGANSKLY